MISMKTYHFFIGLFFVAFFGTVHAQDYYVLQVRGTITIKESQKTIAPGDMLKATDELVFKTQDATAVVMSKTDGRMVLNGKETKETSEGEFLALLKNTLVPMKRNMQMSTRGTSSEEIRNFKDYFGTESFAIIGNELRIKINQEVYPVSNERIFVFRYEYNGKPINKIIQFDKGHMVLNHEALFTINEESVDPESITQADIWYFNRSTDERERVVSFHPIFIDEEQLSQEVTLLKDFLEQNGTEKKEEIKTEIFAFVSDVYGTVDQTLLMDWLNKKNLL